MSDGLLYDITGVILVGGKSRRMGQDKAFLDLGGVPLFERVLRVFREIFATVILVGDRAERFSGYGLPMYSDIYPGSALGGLYTGLHHAATSHIFVSPCDMPFPDYQVIRHLCSLASGHDAVVPLASHGFEPLFAAYGKQCLGPMRDMLERGEFRVFDFYPRVTVRYVDEAELAGHGGSDRSLMNINTPQEYARCAKEASEW